MNTEIFSYLSRDVGTALKEAPSNRIRLNPFTREIADLDELMPGEAIAYLSMRNKGKEKDARLFREEHDDVDPFWYDAMDIFVPLASGHELPSDFNENLRQRMRREGLI